MASMPSVLPTAPLPPAAADALYRLELALNPAARLEAVVSERRRLSASASTTADFDQILCLQHELAMCRCLAMAARYGVLSATIDRLSSRESHYMTPGDWQELDRAQDERAGVYFRLQRAGRLDLIGGAA